MPEPDHERIRELPERHARSCHVLPATLVPRTGCDQRQHAAVTVPNHDTPRWEDINLDDIDYESREGNPTGLERTLRSLRFQIDSTEALLQRYLRELGVSTGGDLSQITIPSHVQYLDPFAFDRARKARNTQSTLQNRRQRFCRVYAQHRNRKEDAENTRSSQ